MGSTSEASWTVSGRDLDESTEELLEVKLCLDKEMRENLRMSEVGCLSAKELWLLEVKCKWRDACMHAMNRVLYYIRIGQTHFLPLPPFECCRQSWHRLVENDELRSSRARRQIVVVSREASILAGILEPLRDVVLLLMSSIFDLANWSLTCSWQCGWTFILQSLHFKPCLVWPEIGHGRIGSIHYNMRVLVL